jgi:hypothetical protein
MRTPLDATKVAQMGELLVLLIPTDEIGLVNGTRCRRWSGTTWDGVPVMAFVALLGVDESAPPDVHDRFRRGLEEQEGVQFTVTT